MPQLKSMLRDRGLKVSGPKSELVARLNESQGNATDGGAEGNATDQRRQEVAGPEGGSPGSTSGASEGGIGGPEEDPVESIARMMLANGVGVPEPYVSKLSKKQRQQQEQKPGPPSSAGDSGAAKGTSRGQDPGRWVQAVDAAEGGADSSASPQPGNRFSSSNGGSSTPPSSSAASSGASGSRAGSRRDQEATRSSSSDPSPPPSSQRDRDSEAAGQRQRQQQQQNKRRTEEEVGGAGEPDELPRLKIPGVVLVEGKFDARAVNRAVAAQEVVALQEWVRSNPEPQIYLGWGGGGGVLPAWGKAPCPSSPPLLQICFHLRLCPHATFMRP